MILGAGHGRAHGIGLTECEVGTPAGFWNGHRPASAGDTRRGESRRVRMWAGGGSDEDAVNPHLRPNRRVRKEEAACSRSSTTTGSSKCTLHATTWDRLHWPLVPPVRVDISRKCEKFERVVPLRWQSASLVTLAARRDGVATSNQCTPRPRGQSILAT